MSVAGSALKLLDRVFSLLFFALVAAMAIFSIGLVVSGVKERLLSLVLFGFSMALGTTNYYYWYHPKKRLNIAAQGILAAIAILLFIVAIALAENAL